MQGRLLWLGQVVNRTRLIIPHPGGDYNAKRHKKNHQKCEKEFYEGFSEIMIHLSTIATYSNFFNFS
jgi:hypothetical protein